MSLNIYKPRYKIAFQSKNKLWSYKDSRLRRFFNIRGRKLIRRGTFKRIFLVFNNMKWTVARRYIRPYRRKRKGASFKQKYKNGFYNKQKLKHFYGSIKEEYFHNFFRKFSKSVNIRNKSFYSTLERRTDMFLFRTRLLPTIYAANQFIHHQGININGRIEKSSNALISSGDILTLDTKYWDIFSGLLYERIYFRVYGHQIRKKRVYTKLRKKIRWVWKKNKKLFKKQNKHILRKIYFSYIKIFNELQLEKLILKMKTTFKEFKWNKVIDFQKNKVFEKNLKFKNSEAFNNEITFFIHIYKYILIFRSRFKKIRKISKYNNFWKRRNYFKTFLYLLSSWIFLCKRTYELKLFLMERHLNTKIIKIKNIWKYKIYLEKNKKKKEELKKEYYLLLNFNLNEIKLKKQEQELFLLKLKELVFETIKRRIKFIFWHKKIIKDSKKEKNKKDIKIKRSSLFYYLKYRKYKKRKRRTSPRLKVIHWYIPSYIHFDTKTMLAIYLYNPLPEEIYYSFKCSLPKIYSFYKSRGF